MSTENERGQNKATRLIIIRHGETVGNREGGFQGRTDSELTPTGELQASLVAEKLKEESITKIYSSSLSRAIRTAEIIRGPKKIKILTDDRLLEMDCGEWEGMHYSQAKEMFPDQFYTWENEPHNHVMPEGESFSQVYERASEVIKEIVSRNTGQTILIVSHCLLIMLFMAYHAREKLNDFWLPGRQCNTAINIVEVSGDEGVHIVTRGDCSHLKENKSMLGEADEMQ